MPLVLRMKLRLMSPNALLQCITKMLIFSDCGGSFAGVHDTQNNPPSSAVQRGDRVIMYWFLDGTYHARIVKLLHHESQFTELYDYGAKERFKFDS